MKPPSVCVVIVNFNGASYIEAAIASAVGQRYGGDLRVVVVDNRSTDDSLEVLRRIDSIEVVSSEANVGFGAAANLGARRSTAEFVAFLNPDAIADAGWVEALVPWMLERRVDFASTIVRAGSGVYFAHGRFITMLGTTLVGREPRAATEWLSACALMARASAFRDIGGFDERFFLYYEDVDLTLRARQARYALGVMPVSLVDHPVHGRSTDRLGRRKARIAYASRGRLIAKHVPRIYRPFALAFTATLSPLRNGVPVVDLPLVAFAMLIGFLKGLRAIEKKRVRNGRPTIGVLANIYESGAGIRAGGHRHFIEVVKRWSDVDLIVFAPEIARRDIARELPQARFEALPSLAAYDGPKALDFLYRSFGAIARIAALRRCDAFLASSHLLPDVLPPILARKPMAVVCHHLISSDSDSVRRAGLVPVLGERLSLRLIRAGARLVISSSQLVIDELRARRFRTPATVSTNGVDHLQFPSESGLAEERRTGVVCVSRLHPAKNLEDALRAWQIVARAFPQERFTIIGGADSAAYEHDLAAMVERLGLGDSVRFAGSVDDRAKLRALAEAKIFLFPSRQEGWGIALAEAMRAGLPCVTYDLPIFAEIFPAGRLAAPLDDFARLAEHVESLLGNEALRVECARAASRLAATFSWERASRIEGRAMAGLLPAGTSTLTGMPSPPCEAER